LVNLRLEVLQQWLCENFSVDAIKLFPITGDAGFRCYYRFNLEEQTFIAVDAPPEKSNNAAFVAVQKMLNKKGLHVPKIIALNLEKGFLCLSDFGDKLFLDTIAEVETNNELGTAKKAKVLEFKGRNASVATNKESLISLYQQAIDLLPLVASSLIENEEILPDFDLPFIKTELSIFNEWLLQKHLNIHLNEVEVIALEQCFNFLVVNALEQPQVCMHRDYHSRNLMMLVEGGLGIIDFQDAVKGPITYDVVSLLRDCYQELSDEKISQLFNYFTQLMSSHYQLDHITKQQWRKWFDLTGLQRHIKIAGIFSRLYYRDNKDGYIKDIPLALKYILKISEQYPELSSLHQLIKSRVIPALALKENKANSKKLHSELAN